MGHRKVYRVPMYFDAPLNEVWHGYLNPHCPDTCTACDGSGYNTATKQLSDDWYDHAGFGTRWRYDYGYDREGRPAERPPWRVIGHSRTWQHSLTQDEVQALVDKGRLYDLTRVFVPGEGWKEREDGHVPTADEVNEWSHHGMGHDGINHWICVETRAKRLGIWGHCAVCGGEGHVFPRGEEQKAAYEAWEPTEPPSGDGWQLWTTTTEGSPITPVFPTPEKLAAYCTDHVTIFGPEKLAYNQWLSMFIEDDVEVGSMFIAKPGYIGTVANEPLG